jgi:hypothetical protein
MMAPGDRGHIGIKAGVCTPVTQAIKTAPWHPPQLRLHAAEMPGEIPQASRCAGRLHCWGGSSGHCTAHVPALSWAAVVLATPGKLPTSRKGGEKMRAIIMLADRILSAIVPEVRASAAGCGSYLVRFTLAGTG